MIRALYVDDDRHILDAGKRFLEEPGVLQIDTATSATEVLPLLERVPYDAVVSDYRLTDTDGITLLKQVRERYPDLPFILFTVNRREDVFLDALASGADGYLQKGGSPRPLFAELRHMIVSSVQRHESDQRLRRLSRAAGLLGRLGGTLPQCMTPEELCAEICTAAVETGGYLRAWLGLLDPGETTVTPVAWAGSGGNPAAVPVREGDGGPSDRPAAAAVCGKRSVVPETDIPRSAAIPLWRDDRVIGVLRVFSDERSAFGSEEVVLLESACRHLTFALERLDPAVSGYPARQELRDTEDRLRILEEVSLTGTYCIQDDRFVSVNRRFAEIFGYSPEELVSGKTILDLVSPECRAMVADNLSMRQSGQLIRLHYSFRGIRGDGKKIHLETFGARAILHGRPVIMGTLRDIGDLRQADSDLVMANRKITLLNTLTRHDIANRLTVLRGRLKVIRKQFSDPELLRQLAKVDDAGRDIFNYLETARLYQKIGLRTPQWQSVERMIARELDTIPAPRPSVSMNVPGLEIYADPLCSRIFANLVDNTIRHGGHATEIQVSYQVSDGRLVLFWGDNGVGIPADLKERIFEQGFGRNTGLGLFLSREIFAITGISVRETGVPGHGVRFEILVPENAWRINDVVPVKNEGLLHVS